MTLGWQIIGQAFVMLLNLTSWGCFYLAATPQANHKRGVLGWQSAASGVMAVLITMGFLTTVFPGMGVLIFIYLGSGSAYYVFAQHFRFTSKARP